MSALLDSLLTAEQRAHIARHEAAMLREPLRVVQTAAEAAAERQQMALAHYSSMAIEALAAKLKLYQAPTPIKVPGFHYTVERFTVDSVEWTCCVSVDEGEAGVHYVQISTTWAPAEEVLSECLHEKLHDAAQRLQDQLGVFARESLQERDE